MNGRAVRTDLRPTDIGRIVALHGEVYSKEFGWGVTFEAYVAEGLAAYALSGPAAARRIWLADDDEGLAGCIAIVGHPDGVAQLRWFVVHPRRRGAGLGTALMSAALDFCRETGFTSVFLWTVQELDAAGRLYRRAGFRRVESIRHVRWGAEVTEEKYALTLRS